MLANLAILSIVAKFSQIPNLCKLAKHGEAHHVGEFGNLGDFGKCDESGEISPNCQTYAN